MMYRTFDDVLSNTPAISLGVHREISDEVSITDVLIDGDACQLRFADSITVNRDIDLRNNTSYKIMSMRVRPNQSVVCALEIIETSVCKELGVDWSCSQSVLDRYDPTRPRLEIRFELDRSSGTIKTLLFDDRDTVLNTAEKPWSFDLLYDYMGNRTNINAKISFEVLLYPKKKSFKLLPKAKAIQIQPLVEKMATTAQIGDDVLTEFKLGELHPMGSVLVADVYENSYEIKSGPLVNPSIRQVHESIVIFRASLSEDSQKVYFESLDEFLRSIEKTMASKIETGKLEFYPTVSGRDVQFRFDEKKTLILNEDGTQCTSQDLLERTNRVSVDFTAELQVNIQRGRYSIVLRAKKITLLESSIADLEKWNGSMSVSKATPVGVNGNCYGSLTSEDGQPLHFSSDFSSPDIKKIGNSLVILRAKYIRSTQLESLQKFDDVVKDMVPEEARYFSPIRESIIEFTLDPSIVNKVDDILNITNHMNIQFTVDYSYNKTGDRWQLILRAKKVTPLELVAFPTFSGMIDSAVDVGEPRHIGGSIDDPTSGGNYFGSFVVSGEPLVLDTGKVILGPKQSLGQTLDIVRCYPTESGLLDFLKRCDSAMEAEVPRLCDTVGIPPETCNYYSIIRNSSDSFEFRIDAKTRFIGEQSIGLDDTNNGDVVLSLDYSINPSKGRIQPIVKAKYIRLHPKDADLKVPQRSSTGGGASSAIKVTEEFDVSEISFEKPSEEATSRQKFVLLRYKSRPRTFLLDTICLEKEEGQSVGLPPPEYEGNKVCVVLKDSNLGFFKKLDDEMEKRVGEMRELFGLSPNAKLSYSSMINDENGIPSCKFTFELPNQESGKNPTQFFGATGADRLPIENIEDLRKHIKLGTVMSNPVVTVSKVWYDKMKKEYALKFKLISVGLSSQRGVVASGFN